MNKDKTMDELRLAVGDFVAPIMDVSLDYCESAASIILFKTVTISRGGPLLITNIEHNVEYNIAFYTVLSVVRMVNQQMLSLLVSEDAEQINQFHSVFKRVAPHG